MGADIWMFMNYHFHFFRNASGSSLWLIDRVEKVIRKTN